MPLLSVGPKYTPIGCGGRWRLNSIDQIFVGQEQVAAELEERGYGHYAEIVRGMKRPYLPVERIG